MERDEPVSGRDVILEVRRNMLECGERLLYRVLVPTSYEVYLHPDDYARLEGVLPELVQETKRALAQELSRLNRSTGVAERVRTALRRPKIPYAMAHPEPGIRILPDANGEVARGDIQVDSRFPPETPAEYTGGSPTHRIFTTRRLSRDRGAGGSARPAGESHDRARVLATLSYTDENGPQTYRMDRPSLVVGRGGAGYWVDLKVRSSLDVSREHVRLRHDPASGRFFLKDLSSLGTTVDGARVPSSVEVVGEDKRDLDLEVPLPPIAVIGLAGVVFLEFRAEAG